MQKTEADLLDASTVAAHSQWLSETDINEDAETLTAKENERVLARLNQAIAEGKKYENQPGLSAAWKRKYYLLKLEGSPTDPKLLAEMTQVAAQLDGMYGKGKYCPQQKTTGVPAKCLSIEELDVMMAKSRDPQELEDDWVGWHKISPPMREKYARLVELSNTGATEFGFRDAGEQWRAGYDMTPAQFEAEMDHVWSQLQPFYEELHAYVRSKLIEKYGAVATRKDGMIPAHLLGNMWAQEWGNIYDLVAPREAPPAFDLEAALKKQILATTPAAKEALEPTPGTDPTGDAAEAARVAAGKAMVKYGERFYTSLGFAPLPETFWERSQFARPRDRDVVCHASAWDVDSDDDLRVKLCVNVGADDFTTVHHELGHNMYQRAYNKQPFLFQGGANDGFHEAIGDSVALAITPVYLKQLGLIDTVPPESADIPLQLRTALDKVAFLPFGLLIDKWRWEVFSGEVKPADYNKAWWALREKYQGVAPPVARSEADFDPGAKYHIPGNVPYARYFLARVYQFQFYKAMCDASGYRGPLNRCTFFGSKEAGAKLNAMLAKGQSQPWQQTMKEMTGTGDIDAGPMLEYFAPLRQWLKEQNAKSGAKPGWTTP